MAIRDLQVRTTRVGRIRTGRKIKGRSGKDMPDRLDTFRFTSPAEHLIEEIAALYGGDVVVWGDSPRNKQWETITDAAMVPVFVPPQKVDPFYEQWGPGVCIRRCDGIHDTVHDRPCDCSPESRKCKPTTRVSLMLADVPGLGVWGLESHGIYFASEMVDLFDKIQGIAMPLPGRLLLENREEKKYNREEKKVETNNYNVPVIFIDGVTSRHIQVGSDAVSQALRLGRESAALAASQATPAISATHTATAIEAGPATPARPVADIPRGLAAIAKASNGDEMAAIANRIREVGRPQELVEAWNNRSRVLAAQKASANIEARTAAAQKAKEDRNARLDVQEAWQSDPGEPEDLLDPSVNVETAPEPSMAPPEELSPLNPVAEESQARKDALMSLLGAMGEKKLKTADLDRLLGERFGTGVDRKTATGAQMRELAGSLS